ncbi:MAG: hypothetical protein L3J29_09975 [Cyclobacteriaceae bacterium]|nr:hypothetical protein [Cyclobacteriaceae bacterium]
MQAISKSVKLIISVALVIQLVSFVGSAATTTVHKKEPTEFVEKVQAESVSNVEANSTFFNSDERKSNISSLLLSKPSHLLAVFGKACFIKYKKQSFNFHNTVKSSLLGILLPHLYFNSSKTSS